MPSALQLLRNEQITCTRCERLRDHCQTIAREKRRAYMDWEYWGKPVPGFGDPNARVLILGLAPGAHGSNRTGRPFTGDKSGEFMYAVLYKTGFASQSTANCSGFLDRELACLKNVRVVVALGRIGFDAYLNHSKRRGLLDGKGKYEFGHGATYKMPDGKTLIASYHPSNQNTATGKLTEKMFT